MRLSNRWRYLILGSVIIMLLFFAGKNLQFVKQQHHKEAIEATAVEKKKTATVKKAKKQRNIDWRAPSMKKAYPQISAHPDLWIHVSLEKQRVYLIDKGRRLYTMYASTGKPGKTATPRGVYHIQGERGDYFYSQSENEGAYYWVSWKNHGEFLFHSTPTDEQKNFIKSDAAALGKRPSSHGCVHLTVADSKWMYENIPYGTKVVID